MVARVLLVGLASAVVAQHSDAGSQRLRGPAGDAGEPQGDAEARQKRPSMKWQDYVPKGAQHYVSQYAPPKVGAPPVVSLAEETQKRDEHAEAEREKEENHDREEHVEQRKSDDERDAAHHEREEHKEREVAAKDDDDHASREEHKEREVDDKDDADHHDEHRAREEHQDAKDDGDHHEHEEHKEREVDTKDDDDHHESEEHSDESSKESEPTEEPKQPEPLQPKRENESWEDWFKRVFGHFVNLAEEEKPAQDEPAAQEPALEQGSSESAGDKAEEKKESPLEEAKAAEASAYHKARAAFEKLRNLTVKTVLGEHAAQLSKVQKAEQHRKESAEELETAIAQLANFTKDTAAATGPFDAEKAADLVARVNHTLKALREASAEEEHAVEQHLKQSKADALKAVRESWHDAAGAAKAWRKAGKAAVKAMKKAHVPEHVFEHADDKLSDATQDLETHAETTGERLEDKVHDVIGDLSEAAHRRIRHLRAEARVSTRRADRAVSRLQDAIADQGEEDAYAEAVSSRDLAGQVESAQKEIEAQEEAQPSEQEEKPQALVAMPLEAAPVPNSAALTMLALAAFATFGAVVRLHSRETMPFDARPLLG